MGRTLLHAGSGGVEWRRPQAPPGEPVLGATKRPSFFELFLPLVVLAVGSILVFAVVLAAAALLLSAVL